jgi:tryptophanyl-tRNA synthetase
MSKPVILTGIRANNDLTIGNYFGAILPIIDMAKTRSDEFQVNLFIPDLHSFTTPIDHSKLYDQILHNARLFVAAGLPLDNPDIYLYRQSYLPAHSELTWILDCFTGFGEMSRMTEFKSKSAKIGDDRVSVGLFNYPVLMAADILLYNAQYIPVGEDQTQHLEFARDISERFNSQLDDTFTVPEPVKAQHAFFGKEQGLRIKDLVDPTKKMSKSDDSDRGVIFLGDDPAAAAKKVMGATTDDLANINFDPQNQPGVSNLLQILALLQGRALEDVTSEFKGQSSYGEFKKVVAEAVESFLADFQTRLASVEDGVVIAKLEQSERDLTPIANATLLRAQIAVGLRKGQ